MSIDELVAEAEQYNNLHEATTGANPLVHEYLSTACWHGDHDYCQSMTGYGGEKRGGRCKFCDARCTVFLSPGALAPPPGFEPGSLGPKPSGMPLPHGGLGYGAPLPRFERG